jgi:hypothetical protein
VKSLIFDVRSDVLILESQAIRNKGKQPGPLISAYADQGARLISLSESLDLPDLQDPLTGLDERALSRAIRRDSITKPSGTARIGIRRGKHTQQGRPAASTS